jgi:hypothetical protein
LEEVQSAIKKNLPSSKTKWMIVVKAWMPPREGVRLWAKAKERRHTIMSWCLHKYFRAKVKSNRNTCLHLGFVCEFGGEEKGRKD